ncbi:CBF-domain-containing protein [Punctularia strigosozonata HHB-11173 SS5]|uniref:CBF-domain-containing protein n=1 Tax=Punctularia strigosozonata (strain HHB-11173) TaxID=741275 RepID=UPI0004418189|nr:CBF-domain-containing protein [Punctularia strigosozonata HHB-11173 SS5]EIN08634.1 CBF-domain-containing protein [Punctularia strigosozonata HHB-11173 SS5]
MAPSSLPPAKKRKLTTGSTSNTGQKIKNLEDELTRAVSSNGSLNPLADLFDLLRSASDAETTSKAMYALYRVFVLLASSGRLMHVVGVEEEEKERLVRTWIWERLDGYVDFLVGLLQDQEKALRTSSLQILLSLQKHLSTALTAADPDRRPKFHVPHFRRIVSGLLTCPPSSRTGASSKTREGEATDADLTESLLLPDVRDAFVERWLSVHDDVRWFFLRESPYVISSSTLLTTTSSPRAPENLLSILERLDTFPTDPAELNAWWVTELGAKPPKTKSRSSTADAEDSDSDSESAPNAEDAEDGDDDDWRKFFDDPPPADDAQKKGKSKGRRARLHQMTVHQSLHALPSHRAVFTRCWLALLPRLTTTEDDKSRREALAMRALNVMHRGVLPHLTRAVLVMDWVGTCVDYGGTVGLLALNALWILIRDYNLDYPSFYTRLYAFLDRDVLHLKHRARFFRMTELFLSSTHLPATLLASFVKRLTRLSLSAPPAAVIMLVPFTYNILKRHPALMAMIHRVPEDDSSPSDHDPFVADEPNPNATRALESSLWELHAHVRHYHPPAATLARVFEAPFTKPAYATEDFLDHTYGTLFETEVKRRIKKEPVVEAELPKVLFPRGAALEEAEELASAGGVDAVAETWVF